MIKALTGLEAILKDIQSIEADPDDNANAIASMKPVMSQFLNTAWRPGVPEPSYVGTTDGVGIRIDWDNGKNFLSIIAKPSYGGALAVYANDGVSSSFERVPDMDLLSHLFIREMSPLMIKGGGA